MKDPDEMFNHVFDRTVKLGNQIAEQDTEADVWDVADGMLAGAVQYWLYSRQPCGDPRCDDCDPVSTAHGRMQELTRLIDELARQSEYYHTASDSNVGRA
ncbi:MAG TPA: hypothetical protein VJS66_06025 [Burkholderiales bacterium]|nr:hypothetical protein [Burkholderiales bacterium]